MRCSSAMRPPGGGLGSRHPAVASETTSMKVAITARCGFIAFSVVDRCWLRSINVPCNEGFTSCFPYDCCHSRDPSDEEKPMTHHGDHHPDRETSLKRLHEMIEDVEVAML